MNCKHIQELLPLYVGRDLEEKRAKLVRAHVQSCPECALSVEEYRESQQLLSLFSPPPFSEAVYSEIRQRVLREIGQGSNTPAPLQLVASFFRPRIRWAVATALLVAVSVVAFYFIASRGHNRQLADDRAIDHAIRGEQADAGSPGNNVAPAPSPSSEPGNGPSQIGAGPQFVRDAVSDGPIDRPAQRRRRKSSHTGADLARSVPVKIPDTASMNDAVSPRISDLAEPNAAPALDPATSAKTLRVELQTKDRNIRIIWFTPQPTKQHSPTKSSKGFREVRSYV